MNKRFFLPYNFLKVLMLPIILIVLIFQITILDYFKLFGVKPDLILAIVIMASLYFDLKWALTIGLLSGILKDAVGLGRFGINTLLFPLWCFLIIKLSRKISLENNFIRVLLALAIVIFNAIVNRFFYLEKFIPSGIFLKGAFLESLYTALTLLLIFRLIKILLANYLRVIV